MSTLLNHSCYESIHNFVTDSSISSNTFIQLGIPSSDSLGKFPKLLKTFATSDMDDCKSIRSRNSIDSDESTKIYAHSTGFWKSQTSPTNISPLRPRPEASKHLSSIFVCLEIDEGNPLHLLETELLLRDNYCQTNSITQVIVEFMRDIGLILVKH